MKGLIKKDLLNLSSYKVSLLITIIFCSIAIAGTENASIAPMIICIIIGMISLSTFNYDEVSKSEKYILSLPVTRKELVISKYIIAIFSVIIGAILGAFLTIIVVNIMNYLRPDNLISLDYDNLFINSLGGIFGIVLIQAIQIPSIYKWGAEKGRIQMFILIFLIVLIIAGTGFLLTKLGVNLDMNQVNTFIETYGAYILILLIIIMYAISYKISYKIFSKKDY